MYEWVQGAHRTSEASIKGCTLVFSLPLPHYAGNGKRKRDEESSESEDEETEEKTPKNKKVTTTPQTFPKANKKVRPARD